MPASTPYNGQRLRAIMPPCRATQTCSPRARYWGHSVQRRSRTVCWLRPLQEARGRADHQPEDPPLSRLPRAIPKCVGRRTHLRSLQVHFGMAEWHALTELEREMKVRRSNMVGRRPDCETRVTQGRSNSANHKNSYERYLMLARNAAQSGDDIRSENFYQHAEHFLRQMRES